ncbi:hypothetical protein JNW88_24315 [Micromonospora sp. ATA32]|nr:hypothetical protein [Micromonospora sp. ATA32]
MTAASGRVRARRPVCPAGTPEERPVSTIHLPADARPGYYDLATSVTQGGGTSGADTVVRVETPEPRPDGSPSR